MAKVLELQLQHPSFQWVFRVDFFKIDWFGLLAFQGTLKSLPQHHSLKASVLRCSAFFIVQLSHLYVTTGNTIALTTWILLAKRHLYFFFFLNFILFFKLYIIVLVLPNIKMNPPQVYICSPSWTLLPPHTIPLRERDTCTPMFIAALFIIDIFTF